MRFTLTVLMFAILFSTRIDASEAQRMFETANDFYSKEAYDSAANYYEKIITSGTINSTVYYNLGNSYYRLKKPGLARLYYEKALKLSPSDKDIETNIKFISANIVDRVPEPDRDFLETLLWNLHILLSLKTQLWLLFSLLLVISLLLSFALYTKRNTRLWMIYISVLLSLVTTVLGISAGIKTYDLEKKNYGIVLVPSLDAVNQPDGSKILFTAHEGTRFFIRKVEGDWSLVSLPNGVSGWIRNGDIGKI